MILVVDCDNFFVSCEKLFAPQLNRKPVVVLSNNDGCIIARSIEAKVLGIPMGAPYFQIKDDLKKHCIHVFSANFVLYCDISERIMATIRHYSHNVEIYSIDEAFVDVSHISLPELEDFSKDMREHIIKDIGIPVSIGVGATKTLAKIATHEVKMRKKLFVRDYRQRTGLFPYFHQIESSCPGFCCLTPSPTTNTILKKTHVSDIWGIGPALTKRLEKKSITNALALSQAPYQTILHTLHTPGVMTQKELQGIQCYPVSTSHSIPKSMMNTRSFGKVILSYRELEEAVTTYAYELAAGLRARNIVATYFAVYVTTKHYDTHRYSHTYHAEFPEPSNSTADFVQSAQKGLRILYKPGYNYRKAGVFAYGMVTYGSIPTNIFSQSSIPNTTLDTALDTCTQRFGKGTLFPASAGITRLWRTRARIRSPHYTTRLRDIPSVH